MSALDGIDPVLVDWIYAWETMRRLGFPSDDLHIAVAPQGFGKTVVALVLAQAKNYRVREFTWTLGVAELTSDQIQQQYERAAAAWNAAKDTPEDHAAWRAWTIARGHVLDLVKTLQLRGFPVEPWPDLTKSL